MAWNVRKMNKISVKVIVIRVEVCVDDVQFCDIVDTNTHVFL